MDNVIANEHVQVLIPPDAGKRDTPRPGWDGGRYTSMRETLQTDFAGGLYRRRKAMVEPVFAQTKHNRRINQFQRRGRSAAHLSRGHRRHQRGRQPLRDTTEQSGSRKRAPGRSQVAQTR
jgi:hypothetical protein